VVRRRGGGHGGGVLRHLPDREAETISVYVKKEAAKKLPFLFFLLTSVSQCDII
jgi:hypothetical protein